MRALCQLYVKMKIFRRLQLYGNFLTLFHFDCAVKLSTKYIFYIEFLYIIIMINTVKLLTVGAAQLIIPSTELLHKH